MKNMLERAIWPERELPSLLAALTGHASASAGSAGPDSIAQFCSAAGWEAQEVPVLAGDAERVLHSTGFGVVQLQGKGWLCLMGVRRGKLRVILPGFEIVSISASSLVSEITAGQRNQLEVETARVVADWEMEEAQAAGVVRALASERLAALRLGTAWRLTRTIAPRFAQQLFWEKAPIKALFFGAAVVAELVLMIAVWFVAGRMVFGDQAQSGSDSLLAIWAALLALTVPVRAFGAWAQGKLVLALGGVMRRHLFLGALRISLRQTQTEGSGQLLGRVIESEVLETLGLSGGLATLVALVEATAAVAVLFHGSEGPWIPVVFLVSVGAVLAGGRQYVKARGHWAGARLSLTHLTVEEMAGHRTRIAQQSPEHWHESEDSLLTDYVSRSHAMDSIAEKLGPFTAGAWLVTGTALMAFTSADGGSSAATLAVTAGGLLLGAQALYRLANGLIALAGAQVAWKQARPLFHAANTSANRVHRPAPSPRGDMVLEARQVDFAYPRSTDLVLKECNLRIRRGDHVLLEGSTGSGKSTLAGLAASLETPIDGMIYAGGHNLNTVGADEWKRRVALAPQFHANHMFSAPLAFNLLLGRNWPPSKHDLNEAMEVAHELGLAPVIDRMPAGMMQMVGETGWRLSQGEQSRVFIARALLQNADLVILDESFASLDPENLHRAVQAVRKRARSLMVIAQP